MEAVKIPKHIFFTINQLFEMENKLTKITEPNSIQRNIERMKNFFETDALANGQGLVYHSPLGERYDETRTDCEATISGNSHEKLEIIEVLKPIIYLKYGNTQTIIQKAVVIVQTKNSN